MRAKTTFPEPHVADLLIRLRFSDGNTLTYQGKPETTTVDYTINRLLFESARAGELPASMADLDFTACIRGVNALYQTPQLWPRRLLAWLKAFPTS